MYVKRSACETCLFSACSGPGPGASRSPLLPSCGLSGSKLIMEKPVDDGLKCTRAPFPSKTG